MSVRAWVQEGRMGKSAATFRGNGILLLDKPAGCTSHDLIAQVKKRLGARKVGHTGTLDPFATGLMVLLVNQATKLSPYLVNQHKRYRFTVFFGVETDTQDSTGRVVARHRCPPLAARELEAACAALSGEIEQVVPRYSAVRVGGQRLYKLARKGVAVELPVRKVTIDRLSLEEVRWPEATFEVTCSKGTYVRSLGLELARYLNCSGHVSRLRRLGSGSFSLKQALTLEELDEILANGDIHRVMIPPVQALESYPELRVSSGEARRMRQGQGLESASSRDILARHQRTEGVYKVVDADGQLVGIVAARGGILRILRVFIHNDEKICA